MSQDHENTSSIATAAPHTVPRNRVHSGFLRPMTVRQLAEAEQAYSKAKFTIDGMELDKVTVVAHVTRVENMNDRQMQYHLEDGSKGRIVAKQWLSEDKKYHLDESYSGYVRIQGKLERFRRADRNTLEVNSVRKVTDPHEFYFHLLEAFFSTRYYEVGPPPSPVLRGLTSVPTGHAEHGPDPRPPPSSMPDTSLLDVILPSPFSSLVQASQIRQPADNDANGSANNEGRQRRSGSNEEPHVDVARPNDVARTIGCDPLSHLNNIQRGIILEILNASPTEEGVHVSVIAEGIKHQGVTAEHVSDALDFLLDQGYIMTTVDIEHYGLTEKCGSAGGRYVLSMD